MFFFHHFHWTCCINAIKSIPKRKNNRNKKTNKQHWKLCYGAWKNDMNITLGKFVFRLYMNIKKKIEEDFRLINFYFKTQKSTFNTLALIHTCILVLKMFRINYFYSHFKWSWTSLIVEHSEVNSCKNTIKLLLMILS